MSRIYEALKNAQEQKSKNELASGNCLGVMEMLERRGSPRTELDIELTVYGHSGSELPFYEQAKGIRGNADGGVFLLTVPVHEGQDLLLINDQNSNKEQICRVVNVIIRDILTSEVVVAFPSPNPEFWGLLAAR
jgi:hypothetical protein